MCRYAGAASGSPTTMWSVCVRTCIKFSFFRMQICGRGAPPLLDALLCHSERVKNLLQKGPSAVPRMTEKSLQSAESSAFCKLFIYSHIIVAFCSIFCLLSLISSAEDAEDIEEKAEKIDNGCENGNEICECRCAEHFFCGGGLIF